MTRTSTCSTSPFPPGRVVGEAYQHLLELRMDRGPMTPEEAEAELRAWWAARA